MSLFQFLTTLDLIWAYLKATLVVCSEKQLNAYICGNSNLTNKGRHDVLILLLAQNFGVFSLN